MFDRYLEGRTEVFDEVNVLCEKRDYDGLDICDINFGRECVCKPLFLDTSQLHHPLLASRVITKHLAQATG